MHAGLDLVFLLFLQGLNIFKPAGQTARGKPKASSVKQPDRESMHTTEQDAGRVEPSFPWGRVIWIHAVFLIAIGAVVHLVMQGGIPQH